MRRTGKYLAPLFLISLLSSGCAEKKPEYELTAMTFNIRYANPSDGIHVWENRKDWVADIINESDAHSVGLQEALRHQIDSLSVRLPKYGWIGRGRSDGNDGGEFSPIFYRTSELDVDTSGTFWLSPWPDSVGSRGWDAALPRIVTWALFRLKQTGETFYHFNTHFDHRGVDARLESARLIKRKIRDIAGERPFILTGDFNTTQDDPPYREIVASDERSIEFFDTYSAGVQEDLSTFRGFEVGSTEKRRIDYIFLSRHFLVVQHTVVDSARNGVYPSDHLPVVVTATMSPRKAPIMAPVENE